MPIIFESFNVPAMEKNIGAFVQKVTIETAEKALTEEVAAGFDPSPVVVTDGKARVDYHSVKPFGKIEFIQRANMAEVVLFALDELRKRSPIKTGRYVAAHTILINGDEITSDPASALRAVDGTDRVQIVNPQPYAKKIEGRASSKKRGVSAERGLSPQAPGGVYRVVLRLLVARYGKSMFFDFKYVKLNSARKVWGVAGGRKNPLALRQVTRSANGRFVGMTHPGRVQRDAVYPALQFYIKPTGLAN